MTTFLPPSNVCFCRRFELYGFFVRYFFMHLQSKCVDLFLRTVGWFKLLPFEWFKTATLRKSIINLFNTYASLLLHFIFACFLLIKHHKKVCSSKGASHWSWLKIATFQKFYCQFRQQLEWFAWKANFCSHLTARRLWTGCSMKGADHCSLERVVWNSYFEKVLLITPIST